jgi:hypothetical protein
VIPDARVELPFVDESRPCTLKEQSRVDLRCLSCVVC